MEDINPTLLLILTFRKGLERGQTIRTILTYIRTELPPALGKEVENWTLSQENLELQQAFQKKIKSPYRQHVYKIIEKGLRGEAVYQSLVMLEEEVLRICKLELEEKIAALPFLMMVPLMLFLFPALVLVTLGPFFIEMLESMGGQPL